MNIFLFLSLLYLFTFFIGKFLEKIKIPWIFSALLLGVVLAIANPFQNITQMPTMDFLAEMGMYFLLFIIGFEINLKKAHQSGKFIVLVSIVTIFLSAFMCGLAIKYVLGYSWLISILVGFSFATVGEAILIPILDEFKLINTKLGQVIIGAGTLDDIAEVLILVIVILLLGSKAHGHFSIIMIIGSLFTLFVITYGLSRLKKQSQKFKVSDIETLFLFTIAIMFLFVGVGEYAEATALGAILSGMALKTFLPHERLKVIENEMKAVCYGLFAPIFFFWAGITMNVDYILKYPLSILLIIVVSIISKISASLIMGAKELGWRKAILLGTGLSVRFSTSIVIITLLYQNELIADDLYSIIIASSIVFTFLVPIVFSQLLRVFKVSGKTAVS